MRRKGTLLGVVIVLLGVLAAEDALAAFPGGNGKLVLSGRRLPDQHSLTYTVNADGTDVTLLTSGTGSDNTPAWSADGTRIMFVQNQVFRLMNSDGSGNHPLPVGGTYENPAWSPDGSKVVLNGPQLLYTMNPDGSALMSLTFFNNSADASQPAWSPSGLKIAFTRSSTSRSDIYTVDAATGRNAASLTFSMADTNNEDPDWSPDGTKLVFRNASGIWTMNADGTNKVNIGVGIDPVWSPDGTKIAYGGAGGVHVMNADGTGDAFVIDEDYLAGLDWQACPGGICPPPPPRPPYDSPAAASELSVSMVPNFRQTISQAQCASRGGMSSSHGPPLALDSCNPPGYLPNTVARLGASGQAAVRFTKLDGDMEFWASAPDVRTAAGTAYNPVPGGGADATIVVRGRLSDRFNGSNLAQPATVSDFDLVIPAYCFADPEDPTTGASCGTNGSINALTPGTFLPGRDAVLQLFDVKMKDAGANGTLGDGDDRFFAAQGLSIP